MTHRQAYRDYRELVIEFLGNRCIDCGSQEELELDHIIPKYIGGKNRLANVQILCKKCHSKKTGTEARRGYAREAYPSMDVEHRTIGGKCFIISEDGELKTLCEVHKDRPIDSEPLTSITYPPRKG